MAWETKGNERPAALKVAANVLRVRMPESGSVLVRCSVNPGTPKPPAGPLRDKGGRFRRRTSADNITIVVGDCGAPGWTVEAMGVVLGESQGERMPTSIVAAPKDLLTPLLGPRVGLRMRTRRQPGESDATLLGRALSAVHIRKTFAERDHIRTLERIR